MAELNLDSETMGLLVQKSIMDAMSPELKEQLITEAIAKLLRRPNPAGRTVLERAFEKAVQDAAFEYIRTMIDEPAVLEQLQETIKPLAGEIIEKNFGQLTNHLNAAVETAMYNWVSGRDE